MIQKRRYGKFKFSFKIPVLEFPLWCSQLRTAGGAAWNQALAQKCGQKRKKKKKKKVVLGLAPYQGRKANSLISNPPYYIPDYTALVNLFAN